MEARSLNERIIATTQALIIVLDVDGRIVTFNPACERVSGYRFEEVSGRPIWDFLLLPEEIDGVKAVFEELRVGHFPNTFENHWVTKSGERRFIEWSNSAVTGESGRVTHVIGTGIDVTEKRAADRALQDSEARFRRLAENLPLVFWVRELPANRISYVSPGYEKIWGRKLVDLDEAFRSFLESIHPDDREMLFRQMERETQTDEATETEYRIIRADGAVRWIHSRAIPIRDHAGQTCQIIGFAEDITDREQVQKDLRETQQRQRALLDGMPDAVWLMDADGRHTEVNRKYTEYWGLKPSDVIGKTSKQFFPASIAERNGTENREVVRSGKPLYVERRWLVDGKERCFDVIKVPILDEKGNVSGIAAVASDITNRRLAEHALQKTLLRQKALLDSIPDIAWLKESDGRYLAVNRVFGEAFRVDPEWVAGKTDFDIFSLEVAAQFAREDRAVMASGEPWRKEELLSRAAGQKWMETVKVPIKGDAGEIIGIAGTSRDITERKLAEAQRIARDAAQRAALVKEIHHRIKNNLQGVITMVERWANRHPEHTDLWDAIAARVNAIASMHGLHGATGERDLRLDHILPGLVSSLNTLHSDLPVQVSIHSGPTGVRVAESEIVGLALVINELIMNALKHSRGGMDAKPLEVTLNGDPGCARITVLNPTGRLPPQFDFDAGSGLGTGLSLVKSLLPAGGVVLRIENFEGPAGVKAELTLRPPIITSQSPLPPL